MSVNPEGFFSTKLTTYRYEKKILKEFLPFGLFSFLNFDSENVIITLNDLSTFEKTCIDSQKSGYFELVLLFLKTRNYKEVNVWPIFGQGQSLLLVMLDNRSMH